MAAKKESWGKKLNGKRNSTVSDARSSCLLCFVDEGKKGEIKNGIREEKSIEALLKKKENKHRKQSRGRPDRESWGLCIHKLKYTWVHIYIYMYIYIYIYIYIYSEPHSSAGPTVQNDSLFERREGVFLDLRLKAFVHVAV
jgi:hypothetical protein